MVAAAAVAGTVAEGGGFDGAILLVDNATGAREATGEAVDAAAEVGAVVVATDATAVKEGAGVDTGAASRTFAFSSRQRFDTSL